MCLSCLWLLVLSYFSFFFFSSRRRHTRFDCDWSSDVCSSDLLVRSPCVRHELLPAGPDSSPDYVHARGFHLGEILAPDIGVRLEEKLSMNVGCHVRCSRNRKSLAVAEEIAAAGSDRLAAPDQRIIIDPESRPVPECPKGLDL